MNALFPAAFAHLMPRDPLTAHASRLYAAMLPEVMAGANVPDPLSYDGEDTDVINSRALRVALSLVVIAAERLNTHRFEREHAARVEKLAGALLVGDEYSSRYARSESDNDLFVVEDAGAALRDAAEDIAGDEWCV